MPATRLPTIPWATSSLFFQIIRTYQFYRPVASAIATTASTRSKWLSRAYLESACSGPMNNNALRTSHLRFPASSVESGTGEPIPAKIFDGVEDLREDLRHCRRSSSVLDERHIYNRNFRHGGLSWIINVEEVKLINCKTYSLILMNQPKGT